jgi:hypothetical protein
MNPVDDQLNRLLRSAMSRGQAEPVTIPYGFETRILAACRAGLAETSFLDMTLLVRALMLASLIMAVSFWPAWTSTSTPANPFAEFLQMTDSTVPADDAP